MSENSEGRTLDESFSKLYAILFPSAPPVQEAYIKPGMTTIKAIISDGTSTGTHVYLEDGREIGNIASLVYSIDGSMILPSITAELIDCQLYLLPSVNTVAKIPMYSINSPSPKWFVRVYPPNWLRKILGWLGCLVNLRADASGKPFPISDDELLNKLKDIK
jgi:hypothetical protein